MGKWGFRRVYKLNRGLVLIGCMMLKIVRVDE